jgi:hypothetical protein
MTPAVTGPEAMPMRTFVEASLDAQARDAVNMSDPCMSRAV